MTKLTRRQFLKRSAGTAALLTACSAGTAQKSATDLVPLGNTGLKISRLGIGCGTHGGRVQRELGTEGFNSLIRYAHERGITYLDTADGYRTHTFIRDAIKGLPREDFFILTKMRGRSEDPFKDLDRFRQELDTDYIDVVLIHCQINEDWDKARQKMMDAFSEAKTRGIIKAHGVSCHSLPATARAAELGWVDVNLVRINPQGVNIDTPDIKVFTESSPKYVPSVTEQLGVMRQNGHGIIGMKIIGEGVFTDLEDRKKSIAFAMQPGLVDSITIGVKSIAEIDEAILNMNEALKA